MTEGNLAQVGRPLPSPDSPAKAAGRTRFLQDLAFPRMLHAKMVFPGIAHALIGRVSYERALQVSGVVAIADGRSVPGLNRVGVVVDDQPLFAGDRVRYEADCVAIVGAETLEAAVEAASLVEIALDPIAAVTTAAEAAGESAPRIHEGGNLAVQHTVASGDPAAGERASDIVVEEVFASPAQEHVYLETQGAIALPGADGSMEILASTQCPFYVRDAVARALGLPLSRVRVVQTPVGGGFGGKEDVPSEIASRAAVLAAATRRPVKLVLSREDDIAYSSKRHPMDLRYRMGCDRAGIIKFAEVEIDADVGAYATLSPIVLYRATVHAAGPYAIPNVRIRSRGYYTNTAPKGAMRGFGTPQVVFACEAMIDEMAGRVGLDPIEFRLRNALGPGSATATGQVLDASAGFADTLVQAREVVGGSSRFAPRPVAPDRVRATGVASMFYGVSLGAAGRGLDRGTAKVEVLKDGSVSVFIGCTDMGQGALTVISQIAAEALGIEARLVTVNPVDTHEVADSGPTVASRATVMSGNAVVDACAKLGGRMLEVASHMMGGRAVLDGAASSFTGVGGSRALPVAEVVRECHARKVNLVATGYYNPPDCSVDRATGQGRAYNTYAFATNVAEVEVDLRTGRVEVLHVAAIHDSGRIVNPLTASGQVEGGMAQGIGLALSERFVVSEGRVVSGDLSTYLVPTALDLGDRMTARFVERPSDGGPFGAKGLGEPAIIAVPAAVANAVSNALGKRIRALPVDREAIAGVGVPTSR